MGPIEYSVFYLSEIIRKKHKDEKLADQVQSIASNCHDAILADTVDGFGGADKVKDKSKILKVNEKNIKFGQSNNLDTRHREIKEVFGEDIRFKSIVLINDYHKLISFKKNLKNTFEQFCLRSLANGRQMEWMQNISFIDAENIILKEYKNESLN